MGNQRRRVQAVLLRGRDRHPTGIRAGIKLAFISGESSPGSMRAVQRFADKLGVVEVYKGCHDKAAAVREFAAKYGLELSELCFIGDDIQDIPAMEIVGLPATPRDAQPAAKAVARFVAERNGGFGVVREILECHSGSARRNGAPVKAYA